MKAYVVFRILTFACVTSVFIISILYYFAVLQEKWFAIFSGVLAVLATVFASLISKPSNEQDLAVAADKLLLTYDSQTLNKLKLAKEEEQRLYDFIDYKGNEIFYRRLRLYLVDELERKYRDSEISNLVEEITNVEAELDRIHIEYDETNLPERFKNFLTHLERKRAVNLMMEMVDAFPFFPFKNLTKLYLKLKFMGDIRIPIPRRRI